MRNCSLRVLALLGGLTLFAFANGATRQNEKEEIRVESRKIEPKVIYEFSRSVGPGRLVKGQAGAPGSVRRTYRVRLRNGRVLSKRLIKEERIQPKDTVMLMGRAGFAPSRHSFSRAKVRWMVASGYDPSPATIGRGATGYTCTGMKARFGCIAVDPRVIKLGTLLYVEGYGFGIASDRGSAIKGNRIDLCFNSKRTADRYGMKRVKVHILSTR